MFKKFWFLLSLFIVTVPFLSYADENVTQICDITHEENIYWSAIDENVTIRTKLQGTNVMPSATFHLQFENGDIVYLGKGSKFIDDYSLPCEDHLNAAITPILETFKSGQIYVLGALLSTFSELESVQQECTRTNEAGKISCDDIDFFTEDYTSSSTVIEGSALQKRLSEQQAPFITVPYSTYGVSVYAFDKSTRKIHFLFNQGC